MVATNELLNIGFSIVMGFSNVVEIPSNAVPTKVEDLQRWAPGHRFSPTDLYLVHRLGTQFWIKNGAVSCFCTPGSYRDARKDPETVKRFLGIPMLSSNQAVQLATTTLEKLIKTGHPLDGIVPKARRPEDYEGQEIPFYWIVWPRNYGEPSVMNYAAFVEIDARKGLVTFLELPDKGFYDYAFAQQISNRVYTPEPSRPAGLGRLPRVPLKRLYPYPTTNQATQAIASWLWLCQRLGTNPGTQTDLASINWPLSYVYTNEPLSMAAPVCQIRFNNMACFESVDGVAYSHFSSDACFIGAWRETPEEEFETFKGQVTRNWQELAKNLERAMVEKLCIPEELLAPFSPHGQWKPPEIGTETIKRLVVDWRDWPRNPGRSVSINETKLALSAEFDLETGELKWISFKDPRFIAALAKAQQK